MNSLTAIVLLGLFGAISANGLLDRFCARLDNVDCSKLPGRRICDNKGGHHRNRCAFTQALCEDRSLRPRRCNDETEESYLSVDKKICMKLAKVDCTKLPTKKVCDNKGTYHQNKCALMKAMCKNKALRPAVCKDVFCKKIMAVNCTAKPTKEICDNKGGRHQNKCAFLQAACKVKGLKPAKCEKPATFLKSKDVWCEKLEQVDCSDKGGKPVCDNKGGKHSNKCAFQQAWCNNRKLKMAKCPAEPETETYFVSRRLCDKLARVNCTEKPTEEVCDNKGGRHQNKCALMKSICEDRSLRPAMCKEDICERVMAANCTEKPGKEVCDNNGGRHQNKCAFTQAWCDDDSLRRVRCSRPEEEDEEDSDDSGRPSRPGRPDRPGRPSRPGRRPGRD